MPTPDQSLPNDLRDVLLAAEVFVHNPYRVAPEERERAEAFMERHWSDVPTIVDELLERGMPDAAKRLLLGEGQWWAITHEDHAMRPIEEALTSFQGREVGISPVDLKRVLSAVDRFFDEIVGLVGISEGIRRVKERAWNACFGRTLGETILQQRFLNGTDVLILGETGTGKEIVASAIQAGHLGAPHGAPPPSPSLSGAAIPENLAESELFGHRSGAFTGAICDRKGKITEADHGTLFIDEVADLPLTVQAKLLRVMETNRVCPLGSNREIPVEVRYISATSRNIRAMTQDGTFREDLYQRIANIVLKLPPLRERREDIAPIAMAFVASEYSSPDTVIQMQARVSAWLETEAQKQDWKGNVRGLLGAIRAHLLDIGPRLSTQAPAALDSSIPTAILEASATHKEVRDWYLQRVLQSVGQNVSKAAKVLDIDRTTIRRHAGRRATRKTRG